MRYYLAIPLPPELSETLYRIKREWQPENVSAPHITIMVPRQLAQGVVEQGLIKVFSQTAQAISPFQVEFIRLRQFRKAGILYLSVVRTQAFNSCFEYFNEAARALLQPSSSPFARIPKPHITLAKGLDRRQVTLAKKQLRWLNNLPPFTCQTVDLYAKDAGSSRRMIHEFTLG